MPGPKRRTEEQDIEAYFQNIDVGPNGCFKWIGATTPAGYGLVWFQGKQMLAHRLAYELLYGPIPENTCVLHRCDTPDCQNAMNHLFLGSKADNTNDMRLKGRGRNGGLNMRRVTPAEKMEMVQRRVDGASWYLIAKKLGRSQQHVKGIVDKYFGQAKKPVGVVKVPVNQNHQEAA